MSRPKSYYISAFDKINEGVKVITNGLLRELGDRADEGWDHIRFNEGCLSDKIISLIVASVLSCHEKDGVIYFSVTSDGTSGADWIKRLERKGIIVGDHAKLILLSPLFQSTKGVTTEVVVLKGVLFGDSERILNKIRVEAKNRKLSDLNLELMCLIRDKFTDNRVEAMGLRRIVAMHRLVRDFFEYQAVLVAECGDGRGQCLIAEDGGDDHTWSADSGFAFVVS